ncbi:MAG: hypothetical protein ACJAZO_002473 [Myxococcota bacterium]
MLLSMLTACGPTEIVEDRTPTPIPATFMTCDTAEECSVLELGCCDHCNGGRAVAVSERRSADVQATYVESCTSGQACTEMGCAPLEATCDQGRCVTVEGEF